MTIPTWLMFLFLGIADDVEPVTSLNVVKVVPPGHFAPVGGVSGGLVQKCTKKVVYGALGGGSAGLRDFRYRHGATGTPTA